MDSAQPIIRSNVLSGNSLCLVILYLPEQLEEILLYRKSSLPIKNLKAVTTGSSDHNRIIFSLFGSPFDLFVQKSSI